MNLANPIELAASNLILAQDNLSRVVALIERVVAFTNLRQHQQQAKLLAELTIFVPELARETLKIKVVVQLVAKLRLIELLDAGLVRGSLNLVELIAIVGQQAK